MFKERVFDPFRSLVGQVPDGVTSPNLAAPETFIGSHEPLMGGIRYPRKEALTNARADDRQTNSLYSIPTEAATVFGHGHTIFLRSPTIFEVRTPPLFRDTGAVALDLAGEMRRRIVSSPGLNVQPVRS